MENAKLFFLSITILILLLVLSICGSAAAWLFGRWSARLLGVAL